MKINVSINFILKKFLNLFNGEEVSSNHGMYYENLEEKWRTTGLRKQDLIFIIKYCLEKKIISVYHNYFNANLNEDKKEDNQQDNQQDPQKKESTEQKDAKNDLYVKIKDVSVFEVIENHFKFPKSISDWKALKSDLKEWLNDQKVEWVISQRISTYNRLSTTRKDDFSEMIIDKHDTDNTDHSNKTSKRKNSNNQKKTKSKK